MERDAMIERADIGMDLQEACQVLTRKQGEALGYWLQGYTQREIGDVLGISQAAVHYRIEGALARLREFLT